jgi:S1-C subfamily serine protease
MNLALIFPLLVAVQPPAPLIANSDFPIAVQEKALHATLRLKNPATNGEGTAVRIKKIGPWIYYLTAAHVVGDAKSVDLECYDLKTYPKPTAKLVAVDVWRTFPEKDLAILRGTPLDDQVLVYLNVVPADKIPTKPGFPVLTLGCNQGQAPTFLADRVRESRRVHKPDGTVGWYWETEKVPEVGRSGGPMIDTRGFLIGVCSGTSDKVGFYVEAREIRSALGKETRALLEID